MKLKLQNRKLYLNEKLKPTFNFKWSGEEDTCIYSNWQEQFGYIGHANSWTLVLQLYFMKTLLLLHFSVFVGLFYSYY